MSEIDTGRREASERGKLDWRGRREASEIERGRREASEEGRE